MVRNNNTKRAHNRGQGVIEYAGALIIATLITTGLMAFAPEGIAGIFVTVINTVEASIADVLAGL